MPIEIPKKNEEKQQPSLAPKYELHTTFSPAALPFLLSLPAGKDESGTPQFYFLDKRSGRVMGRGIREKNEWGGAEIYASSIGKEETDSFLISISHLSSEEKSLINRIAVPKSYGAQQNDWMSMTTPLPPNYSLNDKDKVLTITANGKTARFAVLDSGPAQSEIVVKPI